MRTLLLILTFCLPAFGYEKSVLFSNTAPALAYNVVLYGDGFAADNQINLLLVSSNRFVALTNESWIPAAYKGKVNAWVVKTNATANGSAYSAPQTDTPMGGYMSGVGCYVNQTRFDEIATAAGFGNSATYNSVIFLNRGDYGGLTVYQSILTTNTDNNIFLHEWFHQPTVANLADEYQNDDSVANALVATNTATTLQNSTNKWGVFIPTLGAPVLGGSGWYRPSDNCRMLNIAQSPCLVCSNEIRRKFFVQIGTSDPGDGSTSYRTTITTGTLRFRSP
jgi:hypothetical protein